MLLRFVQPASAKNVYFFPCAESSYFKRRSGQLFINFWCHFDFAFNVPSKRKERNFLTEFYENVIWVFSLYFIHKICSFTSYIFCSNFPYKKYVLSSQNVLAVFEICCIHYSDFILCLIRIK